MDEAKDNTQLSNRTGLDCVRAIFLYFDKQLDADWLWREFAHEYAGFNRQSVIQSLQLHGFSVSMENSNKKNFQKAAFPSLVEFKNGKFALIGKTSGDKLILQVPDEAKPLHLSVHELIEISQPQWMRVSKETDISTGQKFGLAWFFKSFLRYKSLLGETLLASFALQLFALVSPLAFQVVIDKVLVHQGLTTLDVVVLGLAFSSLFEIILASLRTYILNHTTNRVDAELGSKMYQHLLALPIGFYSSRKVGEVVSRVREMESVRAFFTGSGLSSFVDIFFTLFFLLIMAYYSPLLTLVVLISLPLFLAVSMFFIPLLNRHMEDRFVKAAENHSFLVESLAGIETIKFMTAESRFKRHWDEKLSDYVRANFKTSHLANITQQGVQFINKFLSLILLWMGAKLVLSGDLSIGQLIAFNMLSARVNAPILRLSSLWQEFQQMRVSLRRMGDILDTPGEIISGSSLSLETVQGRVSFENVAFRYRTEGRDVLRNLSLEIQPGELIGIVGSSGSGKSTLAKLLMRLYFPSQGRVLLDGTDISGINPLLLRRHVSVVTQDVILFSRTVRENISMGQMDVTFEQLVNASKIAGADDFIKKLPQGYDTVLAERGSNLSGGQRQRIAIARALVMQPRVLILDEATSMLDADTEMQFWQHIRRIAFQRTVIAITHRLSTVLEMDRVIVMEDGQVVEQGQPRQLISANGRFSYLYSLQMGVLKNELEPVL